MTAEVVFVVYRQFSTSRGLIQPVTLRTWTVFVRAYAVASESG